MSDKKMTIDEALIVLRRLADRFSPEVGRRALADVETELARLRAIVEQGRNVSLPAKGAG
jgi:hypothetical protein